MQPLVWHWMPYLHAVRTKSAGLACANLQSCRVHLAPNLQAVPGTSVLSLQAWHEPQKVGIDLGTPSTLQGAGAPPESLRFCSSPAPLYPALDRLKSSGVANSARREAPAETPVCHIGEGGKPRLVLVVLCCPSWQTEPALYLISDKERRPKQALRRLTCLNLASTLVPRVRKWRARTWRATSP